MTAYLIVKVVDVNGQAQASPNINLEFFTPSHTIGHLQKTKEGVFEALIPSTASSATFVIDQEGYWDVRQSLILDQTTNPPTHDYDGEQQINVRQLTYSTRGLNDHNLEVHVVLGQLRDVTSTVETRAKEKKQRLSLEPQSTILYDKQILNPSGSNLLSRRAEQVTPSGTLYFVERTTVPSLIAIWDPGAANTMHREQPKTLTNYNLFFSPNLKPHWVNYPYGQDYLNFLSRYLVMPHSQSLFNKALVYQHAAKSRAVFILPVFSNTEQAGTLNSQAAALRLLQEINYWLNRMRGLRYPCTPLGHASLSCFSNGVEFLYNVLASSPVPEFYDNVLKNIFVIDGAPYERIGHIAQVLAQWFRRGSNGRGLRVYSQYDTWYHSLKIQLNSPTVVMAPGGALEAHTSNSTLLYLPDQFWRQYLPHKKDLAPKLLEDQLHQKFPAHFMEHATTYSLYT